MAKNNLGKQIDQAVQMREAGDLENALILFEKLRSQVSVDDPLYPRVMGEYVIEQRLEAKDQLQRTNKLGYQLLQQSRHEPAFIRAVSNTLVDLGAFESAMEYLIELCSAYPDNSLKTGEAQAHLAYAYLRTGKPGKAAEIIYEAIQLIEKNTAQETYVEARSSYAYAVAALIENGLGNKDKAVENAQRGLDIAVSGKAQHRIGQAKEVLRIVSKRL